MAEQLMDELEKAAQIILAAPNLVTTEQRHNAEEVFLNFRKLKYPYKLCRQILETNTNDYIIFEAVGLIKIALIREWPLLSQTHTSSLRDYLLHYVMNKPNLPPYVEGSILLLIALLIKKGTINDSGQARQAILEVIENLIMISDLPKKLVGYNLIFIITQEYVVNFTYTNIGLSLKTHFNEKKTFQDIDLKRIFKFCCMEIEELIKKDVEEDSITLLKPLLQILESVFTWTFVHEYYEKPEMRSSLVRVDIECVPLDMDINWKRIMLVPAVIDLMFTLYSKIRENPQLAHHARVCLVQMVDITRDYECNKTKIVEGYFIIYVERFLEFITSVNIIDEEANTIAHIFKKLFKFFDKMFNFLPIDKFITLVEQMSRVTCIFLKNWAQKESLCVSECLYKEVVDVIFDAWTSIIFNEKLFSQGFLKPLIVQVFDTYLRCHLSPPEGIRNFENKDLEKKILDVKDTDMKKFERQIYIIGNFGRLIPHYTLPLLAQLIEDRTSKLQEIFNKLVEQTESLHTMKNDSLARLYKDIHWLVLIMSGVICSNSITEFYTIPDEIIRYNIEQIKQGNVDPSLTLQFYVSSGNISSIGIATESVDHVIRLVTSVFRLCAIEKAAMSVLSVNILSPELCFTITSFLDTWSSEYLLQLKFHYTKMSPIYLKCFGGDSLIATWALNFLFEKIEFNINAFKNEPVILQRTMKMLISITSSSQNAMHILDSKGLESIIYLATKGQHDLPEVVKRGLMRSVVQFGIENEVDQSYWAYTLQPLIDKFKQITSNEKFLQCYHQEEIKIQVTDILERFIGVAQANRQVSTEISLYHNIQPILSELPNLISLYHNYQDIQLILELLLECTDELNLIFLYITKTDAAHVSEIYLSAIRNYIRCNINRLTIDSIADEGNYQNILFLMKILINIVSDNILNNKTMSLQDLSIIMPMMTTDLFKFPRLCSQYFEMMLSFCKDNPQKVLDLPSELLQPLLTTMELGLFSFCDKVNKLCCNMIEILVTQIIENVKKGRPKNEIMAPFLNLIITAILTRQVDLYFISNVCISVFYLTYCYQDEYKQIVQNHLSTQSNEQVAQTLDNAFKKLTKHMNIPWKLDYDDERKFKNSYDEFIDNLLIF